MPSAGLNTPLRAEDYPTTQPCVFNRGEGGTGKSRVIDAVAKLFCKLFCKQNVASPAGDGDVMGNCDAINGVMIHPASRFSKTRDRAGLVKLSNGIQCSSATDLYVDGQVRMDWQEKYLLIIDEKHAWCADTARSEQTALQASLMCGGLQQHPHCPVLRRFQIPGSSAPVRERSIPSRRTTTGRSGRKRDASTTGPTPSGTSS